MDTITAASIFSGGSGSDLGLRNAGFTISAAIEWDSCACATYRKNIGPIVQADVGSAFLSPDVVRWCRLVDLLVGGPPCQTFSNANYSDYMSMTGMKNIDTFIRCVDIWRPKYFIMEQAPTLLEARMVGVLRSILNAMSKLEYHVEVVGINTQEYGIPQDRLRTYFLGSAHGVPILHKPQPSYCYGGWSGHLTDKLGIEYNKDDILLSKSNNVKGRNVLEPAYTVMASQTMCIRSGSKPTIGKEVNSIQRMMQGVNQRYLSMQEAQVLQGFPPDYVFCGNSKEQLKQIGNAWSVNVATALAEEVKCLLQKR